MLLAYFFLKGIEFRNIPTYTVHIIIDLIIINQSRNPNWTDDEIYRLLELLQEKEVLQYMKDNRTRNVSIFLLYK